MRLAKTGQIQNCCHPNALMTLKEYLEDYASARTKALGDSVIEKEIGSIPSEKVRNLVVEHLKNISMGQRDFRL